MATDRLTLARVFEDAGIERSKAEAVASAVFDAIHDNVATRTLPAFKHKSLIELVFWDGYMNPAAACQPTSSVCICVHLWFQTPVSCRQHRR